MNVTSLHSEARLQAGVLDWESETQLEPSSPDQGNNARLQSTLQSQSTAPPPYRHFGGEHHSSHLTDAKTDLGVKCFVQGCTASEQQSWDESPTPSISSPSCPSPGILFPSGDSVSPLHSGWWGTRF